MIAGHAGRSIRAALCLGAWLVPVTLAAQTVLSVDTRDGTPMGWLPFGEGQEICLHWNHSVTGGEVADCFENQGGVLTLTRSYLHDFAAGLGDMAGRGTLAPAPEGGYWITAINEPIPGNTLPVRLGSVAVDHRLRSAAHTLPLSRNAAGQSVLLSLQPY